MYLLLGEEGDKMKSTFSHFELTFFILVKPIFNHRDTSQREGSPSGLARHREAVRVRGREEALFSGARRPRAEAERAEGPGSANSRESVLLAPGGSALSEACKAWALKQRL